ncbi:MAG: DUF512 domain-containing protein, partial [Candidatus Cloacimonetes bacterium]|nr:DUF512 domain-containing protein [Candidatus Cloacimonadota bacterium]
RKGIEAGWELLSINGNEIEDFFDLQYYSSDFELNCELLDKEKNLHQIQFIRKTNKALGIEPEAYNCRNCANNCIFCFIDQMPPGLRKSLYVKDDDYLYSFVFGNYITLSNLREDDLKRIVSQHISPLFISIHSTSARLRKKLMRYKKNVDVLAMLEYLADCHIGYHLQLVLLPGYNDARALSRTLEDLLNPMLRVESIGLVPVGLTKYRSGLTKLKPFNQKRAIQTLNIARDIAHKHSIHKIYCADEFFILAGEEIPNTDYYDDFPQIENGIGMLRLCLDNFERRKRQFLKELRRHDRQLLFVTSKSAYKHILGICAYLNRILDKNLIRVQLVRNDFFGELISVSGLLTFQDLKEQILLTNETLVLPNNIFNHEGVTLDGYSQLQVKEYFSCDLLIVDHLFEDWEWI